MNTHYEIRNINGHIEVYDPTGRFLFSADNEREALQELEHIEAA